MSLQTVTQYISDYDNPNSLGSKFRLKRTAQLLLLMEKCFKRYGHVNVLDIGGRANYWDIIPDNLFHKMKMSVTMVNTQSELDVSTVKNSKSKHFVEIIGNGCSLPHLKSNSFQIVHSNSVIEHVGEWKQMKKMAKEITRLAPFHYVQTPAYWFPIEPHFMTPFFHWLPEPLRVSLLMKFNLGHMSRQHTTSDAVEVVQSAHLLDEKMMQSLFPDSQIKKEKCLFMTKSLIAIKGM